MSDAEFLQWLHDRLIFVYGEHECVDFLHRLRKIIAAHEALAQPAEPAALSDAAIDGIADNLHAVGLIERPLRSDLRRFARSIERAVRGRDA